MEWNIVEMMMAPPKEFAFVNLTWSVSMKSTPAINLFFFFFFLGRQGEKAALITVACAFLPCLPEIKKIKISYNIWNWLYNFEKNLISSLCRSGRSSLPRFVSWTQVEVLSCVWWQMLQQHPCSHSSSFFFFFFFFLGRQGEKAAIIIVACASLPPRN